jgi:hypothetical protein
MNKTLRQEIKQFVEDMKEQEAGLIKRAGEAVMEMPAEEIFNKPRNFSTNMPEVTEKQIFLHRLKSKLSIIQEYRSQLENILENCPEPQPLRVMTANYQPIIETKANSTFERICSGGCGKKWKCKGECQDEYKFISKDSCNCPECLKKYGVNLNPQYKCPSRFPPQTNAKPKAPQQKTFKFTVEKPKAKKVK